MDKALRRAWTEFEYNPRTVHSRETPLLLSRSCISVWLGILSFEQVDKVVFVERLDRVQNGRWSLNDSRLSSFCGHLIVSRMVTGSVALTLTLRLLRRAHPAFIGNLESLVPADPQETFRASRTRGLCLKLASLLALSSVVRNPPTRVHFSFSRPLLLQSLARMNCTRGGGETDDVDCACSTASRAVKKDGHSCKKISRFKINVGVTRNQNTHTPEKRCVSSINWKVQIGRHKQRRQ